jgi:hypothetical protein
MDQKQKIEVELADMRQGLESNEKLLRKEQVQLEMTQSTLESVNQSKEKTKIILKDLMEQTKSQIAMFSKQLE